MNRISNFKETKDYLLYIDSQLANLLTVIDEETKRYSEGKTCKNLEIFLESWERILKDHNFVYERNRKEFILPHSKYGEIMAKLLEKMSVTHPAFKSKFDSIKREIVKFPLGIDNTQFLCRK